MGVRGEAHPAHEVVSSVAKGPVGFALCGIPVRNAGIHDAMFSHGEYAGIGANALIRTGFVHESGSESRRRMSERVKIQAGGNHAGVESVAQPGEYPCA